MLCLLYSSSRLNGDSDSGRISPFPPQLMEERLKTFFGALVAGTNPRLRARTRKRDWPHSKSSARAVAMAGFVYRPTLTESDRTECVDCGSFCSGWKANKLRNPLERHLELDSNCVRYPKASRGDRSEAQLEPIYRAESEAEEKDSRSKCTKNVLPPAIVDHVKSQLARSDDKPALALRFLEQILNGIGGQASALLNICTSTSRARQTYQDSESSRTTPNVELIENSGFQTSPGRMKCKIEEERTAEYGQYRRENLVSPICSSSVSHRLSASPSSRPATHISHARRSSLLFQGVESPSHLPSPICRSVNLSPHPQLLPPLSSPLASPLKLICTASRRESFSTQISPDDSRFNFKVAMKNLGIAIDDQFDAILEAISPYLNIFEFYNALEDCLVFHIDNVTEVGIGAIETEARQALDAVEAI